MNYSEACDCEVTRNEAYREIHHHHQSEPAWAWAEFLRECGDKDTYSGQAVLDWLGY